MGSLHLHFFVQVYLIYFLFFVRSSNLEKPYNHLMVISYAYLKGRGEKKQLDSSTYILITILQGTLPFEQVGDC